MSDTVENGTKLARDVISRYADWNRLPKEECEGLGIKEEQCDALCNVMSDGYVTSDESEVLTGAGFSKSFIAELSGKLVLYARVKGLGERLDQLNEASSSCTSRIKLDRILRSKLTVIENLRKIGPDAKDAVPALERALDDGGYKVCISVVRALKSIGTKEAVAGLTSALYKKEWKRFSYTIEALNNEQWKVRMYAAEALGRLGPDAMSAVYALNSTRRNDEDSRVRGAATEAIRKIRRNR